jgi:hypothetical protein
VCPGDNAGIEGRDSGCCCCCCCALLSDGSIGFSAVVRDAGERGRRRRWCTGVLLASFHRVVASGKDSPAITNLKRACMQESMHAFFSHFLKWQLFVSTMIMTSIRLSRKCVVLLLPNHSILRRLPSPTVRSFTYSSGANNCYCVEMQPVVRVLYLRLPWLRFPSRFTHDRSNFHRGNNALPKKA